MINRKITSRNNQTIILSRPNSEILAKFQTLTKLFKPK